MKECKTPYRQRTFKSHKEASDYYNFNSDTHIGSLISYAKRKGRNYITIHGVNYYYYIIDNKQTDKQLMTNTDITKIIQHYDGIINILTSQLNDLSNKVNEKTETSHDKSVIDYYDFEIPDLHCSVDEMLENEKKELEKKTIFQMLKHDLCNSLEKLPQDLHKKCIRQTIDDFVTQHADLLGL